MASGNITTNAPSPFQTVTADSVHIAIVGTFGGASVALEQEINDTPQPVLDGGVAIVFTADNDDSFLVQQGDRIRLNTTGGTAHDIDFNIAGAELDRS